MTILPPNYIAELVGAEEVGLRGGADLTYWREFLAPLGLKPLDVEGGAELLISSVNARWMRFAVRELSFSVSVHPRDDDRSPAAFLLAAYHSSRLFAFLERTFFATPYTAAQLTVQSQPVPLIELRRAGEEVFHCCVRPPATPMEEDSDWEGVIYLPRKGTSTTDRKFFARLSGRMRVFPFTASDPLRWREADIDPVFTHLAESQFTGRQWRLRFDARHSRSKTFRQSARMAEAVRD